MTRRELLQSVSIGAAVAAASEALLAADRTPVARAQRPNIVVILVDDLGWQDVACYYRDCHKDEPFCETPHMDRLAKSRDYLKRCYDKALGS